MSNNGRLSHVLNFMKECMAIGDCVGKLETLVTTMMLDGYNLYVYFEAINNNEQKNIYRINLIDKVKHPYVQLAIFITYNYKIVSKESINSDGYVPYITSIDGWFFEKQQKEITFSAVDTPEHSLDKIIKFMAEK